MSECHYRYRMGGEERTCSRPAVADADGCVFHLTPAQRREANVTSTDLRAAFVADIEADDPTRREYVDVHLADGDLSELVADGGDVARVRFRDLTVDGTLDLSGAVLGHPLTLEGCRIGELDVTGATFERDVVVEESDLGADGDPSTCFRARRASFERNLRINDVRLAGSAAFARCSVGAWLDVDTVTFDGRAHFPQVTVGTAQFVSTAFEDDVEFVGATADRAIFEEVSLANETTIDLAEGSYGLLRVSPATELACTLREATVSEGRLGQPADAVATYDLTDATVGDVELDCESDTFDRYRFYRTRFEGFHFASYRGLLRANHWRLHEFVGDPIEPDSVEGLEHTYLEAKQGASVAGDGETASKFFVAELRYRRRRYAAHARSSEHSPSHRLDAAVRWLTNGFLDVVAGYGERPHRTAALALVVIVGSALVYPATGGLTTGGVVVRYGTHGVEAVLNGLYFSVVTFATLGLGDVHPVGDIGRMLAASEGLGGAFLTAVFVFSLGRRVTR